MTLEVILSDGEGPKCVKVLRELIDAICRLHRPLTFRPPNH